MKPEPDDATPLLYQANPSFIDLPIELPFKDIQNQTNKYITGLVYEDKDLKDDDLAMTIYKTAPISISSENGKIKTIFPMKAHIKYRIGTQTMGMDLSTTREFDLNGTLTLLSSMSLKNWQVSSKTEVQKIDWKESPTTTVMGRQIPITHLINPAVKFFRDDLEKSLDEAISKSMNFQPQVLNVLETLTTPFQMNEQFDTWLRVVPIELYSTNAQILKDHVKMEMGMKCTLESFVGKKPDTGFDKNKVVMKAVAKMPDHIAANIMAISTYEDASRVVTNNFKGQVFGDGSQKVTVNKVNLWHKSGKMIIALDLMGSLTGQIYLSGVPKYDAKTKEIYIDQIDYAIDTKSKLIKTANWMASGMILKKISGLCRYSIVENIEEGKKSMLTYMNNYSPMKGVFINGQLDALDFNSVQLTNRAIIAQLVAKGKVRIKIDGLD